jgi:hypothetical protein
MLERYTHPTLERRVAALDTFNVSTICPQKLLEQQEAAELADFLRKSGGRQEARTPDLRVANDDATEPKICTTQTNSRRSHPK